MSCCCRNKGNGEHRDVKSVQTPAAPREAPVPKLMQRGTTRTSRAEGESKEARSSPSDLRRPKSDLPIWKQQQNSSPPVYLAPLHQITTKPTQFLHEEEIHDASASVKIQGSDWKTKHMATVESVEVDDLTTVASGTVPHLSRSIPKSPPPEISLTVPTGRPGTDEGDSKPESYFQTISQLESVELDLQTIEGLDAIVHAVEERQRSQSSSRRSPSPARGYRSRTPSPSPMKLAEGAHRRSTPSPLQSRRTSERSRSRTPSPAPSKQTIGHYRSKTPSPSPTKQTMGHYRNRTPSPSPTKQLIGKHRSRTPSPSPAKQTKGQYRSRTPSPSPTKQTKGQHRSRTPSPSPTKQTKGQHRSRTPSPSPNMQNRMPWTPTQVDTTYMPMATRQSPHLVTPSPKRASLPSHRGSPTPTTLKALRDSPTILERSDVDSTPPDTLSDLPSDLDTALIQERYEMACKLLVATLMQKDTALRPKEKSFLRGLIDAEEATPSEAQLAAIEHASATLQDDPLFQVGSVTSSSFDLSFETGTSVTKEEEAARKAVASFAKFDGMDYPFRILGVNNLKQPSALTPALMEALRGFFPSHLADCNFWLNFDTRRDGSSLSSLLRQVRTSRHTLVCVETTDGYVFGAFCSAPWRVEQSWYGSRQCFLWRLKHCRRNPQGRIRDDSHDSEMEVYPYTGHDDQLQYCSVKTIAIGGGDWNRSEEAAFPGEPRGIGLSIDGDLMGGETNSCATFSNPRLGNQSSVGNEFDIERLQVWTITPCNTLEEAEHHEMYQLFVEERARAR